MQSEFKTQQLSKSNFDWTAIYPTEQAEMTSALNYNFNLQDVQSFLKKASNNFSNMTAELYDLDRYLYSIYEKSTKSNEPEPTPEPAPTPTPEPQSSSPEERKKDMQKRLSLLKLMQKKKPNAVQASRIKLIEKMLSK